MTRILRFLWTGSWQLPHQHRWEIPIREPIERCSTASVNSLPRSAQNAANEQCRNTAMTDIHDNAPDYTLRGLVKAIRHHFPDADLRIYATDGNGWTIGTEPVRHPRPWFYEETSDLTRKKRR